VRKSTKSTKRKKSSTSTPKLHSGLFTKTQLAHLGNSFAKEGNVSNAQHCFNARKMCQQGQYSRAESYLAKKGIFVRSLGLRSKFKALLPLTTTQEHPHVITVGRIDSSRQRH
jgi:hypothetical protein